MALVKIKTSFLVYSIVATSWIGFIGAANATMYSCENDHTVVYKRDKIVVDTTDVYLAASYPNYRTYKGAKFESMNFLSASGSDEVQFIEAWSKQKGYVVMLIPRVQPGKDWDYKNTIRCRLANPNEEPPAPPAQLN
ncbi:hypothetical protein ACEV6Q_04270 [Enterobacter ludwigii]|uniref:hypothetical protein n=1 Tax=Enterobacter ludwigii TaxID=299767 RepID=UPI003BEF0060